MNLKKHSPKLTNMNIKILQMRKKNINILKIMIYMKEKMSYIKKRKK